MCRAAKFELDVGQGMFQDLFGIGEAAVAGVVEGLAQSAAADGGEDEAKATAEGLAAVQHVVQLVGKFVQAHGYMVTNSMAIRPMTLKNRSLLHQKTSHPKLANHLSRTRRR